MICVIKQDRLTNEIVGWVMGSDIADVRHRLQPQDNEFAAYLYRNEYTLDRVRAGKYNWADYTILVQ